MVAKRGRGEGSIYQRKDGRWTAEISVEGGKSKFLYGKTRKEVQEKLKVALYEQQKGMLVTGPQQKVGQFLTHWLEDVHKQSIRSRTYERYEEIVRLHLVPGIGHHQLQKLSPQHIQSFYKKKLEEGLSNTTVISFHNILHKALETAVRWNLIGRNTCDLVSPPRRKRFEIQPLTMQQIHQFLAVAHGHRQEALFILALATGMRRGELLGLKWQDIDMNRGVLQVRRILSRIPSKLPGKGFEEAEPKTERGRRSIVLPPFTIEVLKQHRIRQLEAKLKAGLDWQEHDYVFCTSIGTHLNPTRDVLAVLKSLLVEAGLPHIRFHDLRHSSATMLLGMKVHPKIVQEILGHSQISITMDIYSHVLPTMQEEAMNKLNDALQQ
ncbi:tyrosine-type recombinase/integrase [Dictyobacter aurantiacus]|uniref:Site-specific integrase n=1 Tax=Dictyobacter aurantiacus TaxID=1936993 RepID=A0A401Z9J8_9CHLR|nr:tyrosine-type recombinase/integrase [Dictyobacter aurantiacus]GCE03525.1 site-specific integrase [Dictyobacter aurantiacus]